MKHILLTFMLSIATVGASAQKLPAYLDTNRSVEERTAPIRPTTRRRPKAACLS